MVDIVRVVRSSTPAEVPTTLAEGQLAVNLVDNKIWIGGAGNVPVLIYDSADIATHASNVDAHHAKSHTHDGIDGSGQVDYSDILNPPTIPPAQTYLHDDLTDVSADQHHPQLHTVESHSDVTLTAVETDQVLVWNGTKWVNTTPQTGVAGHPLEEHEKFTATPADSGKFIRATNVDGVLYFIMDNPRHDLLGSITSDDHHAKSHAHNGSDGSGTVAYTSITGKPTLVTDHGALTGLGDDDHTQYTTETRAEALFDTKHTGFDVGGMSSTYTGDLNNLKTNARRAFHTDSVTNEPAILGSVWCILEVMAISALSIIQIVRPLNTIGYFYRFTDDGSFNLVNWSYALDAAHNKYVDTHSTGETRVQDVLDHILQPPSWTNITTWSNSWQSQGATYTPGYMKTFDGIVHLRGLMAKGTIAATAFTLPSGFQPAQDMIINTRTADANGELRLTTGGTVELRSQSGSTASSGWTSLCNISFSV